MPDRFVVKQLSEIPEVPDPEPDDPEWKPVRHHLDIRSFGINAFLAHDEGRRLVPDHTEDESGHEELYVVLSGEATFTIESQTIACPAGTLVAVRDPAVRRSAVSARRETTLLAVAGIPGRPYEVSRWDARWTTGLPQA